MNELANVRLFRIGNTKKKFRERLRRSSSVDGEIAQTGSPCMRMDIRLINSFNT